jgi:AraC family transcriptional regulator
MTTENTRQEHISRLNRVINYIHDNLDRPLTLGILSEVAGFSPFHFHHIFKSLVGETLNEYIQRARLEKSANLLLSRPGETIIDTAAACGFSSAAAFSRAFRTHFKSSPSDFRSRKRTAPGKENRKPGKDPAEKGGYNLDPKTASDAQGHRMSWDVEIKKIPDLHVAFIRHIQGYRKSVSDTRIRQAFEQVCKWAYAKGFMDRNTLVIGIPHDNPGITPIDRCRYDACVTIPAEAAESQGAIGIQDIPGGKYAVCRIEIGVAETHRIGEMVDFLYGEWLPDSGCQADDKPPLEIYHDTPGKKPGTWICMEYCLPVRSS